MRIESSVTSISWIPSEAIKSAAAKLPFDLGIVRYDDPPPDSLGPHGVAGVEGFRFANELRAWIEVEDGAIVSFGRDGGGSIGVTHLQLGPRGVSVHAIPFHDIHPEPEVGDSWVRFTQTAGGRTGVPAPRTVARKPFVQIAAPIAWTTVTLTLHADGSSAYELAGASPFPRHWLYDDAGTLVAKSGLIDFKSWWKEAFGTQTPWGGQDSATVTSEAESALEHELAGSIMRAGGAPRRRRLEPGDVLVGQGEPGDELFLVLDGVLSVDVDEQAVAEVGPGTILGERAGLEGGRRTSTLTAVTACRVAVVGAGDIDEAAMAELSRLHRREQT
jgi:hypothetical protein